VEGLIGFFVLGYFNYFFSLLGNWAEAHLDFALSCKLDYDDQANEWLKEVEPNVSFYT